MRTPSFRTMARLLGAGALTALLAPALAVAAPSAFAEGHTEGAEHEHCEVAIANLGDAVLSPGQSLVHHDRDALWSPGLPAGSAIELLAETGDPGDLFDPAQASYAIPAIPVGGVARYSFDNDAGDGVYLSTINKLMDSNDSFVGVANVRLFTDDGEPARETLDLLAWDAGTEENQPLGGGFAAGQPDAARGDANIDNGEPTGDGVITANNPQYGNQPQARLTLRCESVAMSHEEALAIQEEGGDPFTIGIGDAAMPPEPDPDAARAGDAAATPADGAMPPEPNPDAAGAGDGPAEPPTDAGTPSEPDDGAVAAPRTGTGLAPDEGGAPVAPLAALAALMAVAALGGAALAVRRRAR